MYEELVAKLKEALDEFTALTSHLNTALATKDGNALFISKCRAEVLIDLPQKVKEEIEAIPYGVLRFEVRAKLSRWVQHAQHLQREANLSHLKSLNALELERLIQQLETV